MSVLVYSVILPACFRHSPRSISLLLVLLVAEPVREEEKKTEKVFFVFSWLASNHLLIF